MNITSSELFQGILALDQKVLHAADIHALSAALVDWAREVGADGAYVGEPDPQGWIRPETVDGEGMQAYPDRARMSILDTCTDEHGTAGRAWRTQQVQVAVLRDPDDRHDTLDRAGSSANCRVSATVPLCRAGQCVALFSLFGRDADDFSGPDWATALAHIGLIAGVALDRQHLRAEQERLSELALRDPLTGLPNMTALEHHIERAVPRSLRANLPLVIGLLDLDRFKPVNDLFGHEAGDHVLQEMARRLQSGLRADDFLARRSGDEFVLVMEGVEDPVRTLGSFLERLHSRLTEPIEIGHVTWQCGVSLGLALYPNPSTANPAAALLAADAALRSSKAQKGQRQQWWSWAASCGAPDRGRSVAPAGNAPDLYGTAWIPGLTSLSAELQRNAADIVNEFYEHLTGLPKSRVVLEALSGRELQHLKAQQIQNLFALADPGLTEADHCAMALRVGRIHAIVGLDLEELVRSRGILAAAAHSRLEATVHSQALSVLSRRLNRDLAYQAQACQKLQDERQDVLLRIARLAWEVENYADLIGQVVDILGTHDEVAGCSIGRPDRQGVFRVESVSGRTFEKHLAEPERTPKRSVSAGDSTQPQDTGLTGLAWRSGKTQRCINVATDSRMAQWKTIAIREGLRSSVAIPLCQPGHAPMAILTLHSTFPGGYTSADQMAFTDLLQTLLAFAMGRIANLEGATRTIPYAMRQQWAELLRSDALQMHYQPILDLKTGQVTKVAALARLFDGNQLLTPQQFFPALSSDDFLALYARGLAQALSQRDRWSQDGIDLNVSVNLPSGALSDSRYFEVTRHALAEHGCPPERLTLEILETDAFPPDLDVCLELARFKALGVVLAEDDLGAGHSSLARLHELPFDWIKIDLGIVNLAGRNTANVLSFIYQMTRLGHSLGRFVIVEGVEDTALLEAIVILGADAVQGHAIGRPMPAQHLEAWMRSRSGLPDLRCPQSALGKLANLLIWEERLHLISRDPPAFDRLAEIVKTAAACPAGRATQPSLESCCQGCPLSRFFIDMEFAPMSLAPDIKTRQALLEAAVTHGPHSEAYRLARQRLVEELGG